MRKIWNDLQKLITWNELERSEVPMFSSKLPIIGDNLENKYQEIISKVEYANYLSRTRILGNILIDITFSDVLFINSYMVIRMPRSNGIITGISEPDGY